MGPTTFKILIEQPGGVGCMFAVSCPSFTGLVYGAQSSNNGV